MTGIAKKIGLLALALPLMGWSATASAGNFMPTGGRATQPVGHYEFCQR